jgi:hypothetical protein
MGTIEKVINVANMKISRKIVLIGFNISHINKFTYKMYNKIH